MRFLSIFEHRGCFVMLVDLTPYSGHPTRDKARLRGKERTASFQTERRNRHRCSSSGQDRHCTAASFLPSWRLESAANALKWHSHSCLVRTPSVRLAMSKACFILGMKCDYYRIFTSEPCCFLSLKLFPVPDYPIVTSKLQFTRWKPW